MKNTSNNEETLMSQLVGSLSNITGNSAAKIVKKETTQAELESIINSTICGLLSLPELALPQITLLTALLATKGVMG